MKKRDLDDIARLEKLIAIKYGPSAVENPKNHWDEEKEREYIDSLKRKEPDKSVNSDDKIEIDGFLIDKNLIIDDVGRVCPVCNEYSFRVEDDLYMTKFDACFRCYVKHIEGREELWSERKKELIDANFQKNAERDDQ